MAPRKVVPMASNETGRACFLKSSSFMWHEPANNIKQRTPSIRNASISNSFSFSVNSIIGVAFLKNIVISRNIPLMKIENIINDISYVSLVTFSLKNPNKTINDSKTTAPNKKPSIIFTP